MGSRKACGGSMICWPAAESEGGAMSVSVLYMSMSLDGYVAGPNDGPDNPGGDGFARLHEWFVAGDGSFIRPPGAAGEIMDEVNATGSVLAGRRTVEQVDYWKGNHHAGVPIFVPSHRPPVQPSRTIRRSRTSVTESPVRWRRQRRRRPTRTCWCTVRSPRNTRSRQVCLTSCRSPRSRCTSVQACDCSTGLQSRIELDIVRVIDTPEATHIRYRVRR